MTNSEGEIKSTFKEEDIRPADAHATYKRLFSRDLSTYFIDSNTGKLKEDIASYVDSCYVCGNSKEEEWFMKGGFRFVRCAECGFVYINPRPQREALLNFANSEASSFFTRNIRAKTAEVRKQKIFKPRAQRVREFLQGGKILDVGCSGGDFLEMLKDEFDVYGVEPNKEAVNIAQKKGISVFEGFIEDIEFQNEHFDAVIAWELIEHLFDPRILLDKVNKLLSDGGLFFLTTPNIDGFEYQVLGQFSQNLGGPNHLNYFSVQTIEVFLQRFGYEIVDIRTPGVLDVDLVIKGLKEQGGETPCISDFLQKLLFSERRPFPQAREKFQRFLQEALLSGHMEVVARKELG